MTWISSCNIKIRKVRTCIVFTCLAAESMDQPTLNTNTKHCHYFDRSCMTKWKIINRPITAWKQKHGLSSSPLTQADHKQYILTRVQYFTSFLRVILFRHFKSFIKCLLVPLWGFIRKKKREGWSEAVLLCCSHLLFGTEIAWESAVVLIGTMF